MKIFQLIVLLLLQMAAISQPPNQRPEFSDRVIFHKTILLENTGKGHGTGFIVAHNNKHYLVTAEHVFVNLQDSTKAYFKDSTGKASYFLLGDLMMNKGRVNFLVHRVADVAIAEIYPKNHQHSSFLKLAAIPFEYIHGESESVPRQFNIIVYGYPMYDFDFFEPMSYSTYLSSGYMKLERADKRGKYSLFYLLSDPGMQGFSGGPVYVGVSNPGMMFGPSGTFIVGIVHGTRGDISGGKYAVITPSFYIAELLKAIK